MNRDLLIGKWYRSAINDDNESISEYAELAADGSFEFSFVIQQADGTIIEEVIELGDWGLVGDVHFTITKNEVIDSEIYPVDLAQPDNYNAYMVIELTNKSFVYQHVVTNEIFISRRVNSAAGNC